jgi:hypothetical protein
MICGADRFDVPDQPRHIGIPMPCPAVRSCGRASGCRSSSALRGGGDGQQGCQGIGRDLGRVWSRDHVLGLRLRIQMIDSRSWSPAR